MHPKACAQELWTGEHDAELMPLATMLPAHYDSTPGPMRAQLEQLLTPISRLFQAQKLQAAMAEAAVVKEPPKASVESVVSMKLGTGPCR